MWNVECGVWNEICFQEEVIGAKSPTEMFVFTQRRRGRRVHTEEYFSHRNHGNHRNDERVRTELYLYKLCRARRSKAKPNLILKVISAKNIYNGINGNKRERNGNGSPITWREPKKRASRPFDGASLP